MHGHRGFRQRQVGAQLSRRGGGRPHHRDTVVTVVAVPVLYAQWRRRCSETPSTPGYFNLMMLNYGVVYLAVMAVLWACALPSYLSAVDGVTTNGGPTGNLWYALACFRIAGLCLAAAFSAAASRFARSVFGRAFDECDPVTPRSA